MTSLESSFQDGKHSKLSILVDTSQKDGRLLVTDENYKIVFSSSWNPPLRHTDQLTQEFKKCKALFAKYDPHKIYFISGPGSFTGLRVGAAFVKTLGLVYKKTPLYCINSFNITASHVLKKLDPTETFSVCISSVGNMVFKSTFEFADKVFHKETVSTSGAEAYTPNLNKVFSPNPELCEKFSDIALIKADDADYLNAIGKLDQNEDPSIVYTHLDLYPLYLRKSEAEEKYRYDKTKLQIQ